MTRSNQTVQFSLQGASARLRLGAAASRFRRDKALHLPGLLNRGTMALLAPHIRKSGYVKRRYGFAQELLMKENGAWNLLHFLVNDASAMKAFRRITANPKLKFFSGRIYKMLPARHYLEWHDDLKYNRLCALSVNLSPEKYSGGRLQLRERKNGKIIFRSPALKPGDGVIFSIGRSLEHRLTPVRGRKPRIAYAGWFFRKPENRWFKRSR